MKRKINMGCGENYKKGFLNVDVDPKIKADIHHDLNVFPYPLKSNSFDYIYCDNILEHLHSPIEFFIECKRLLRRDGILHILYPNMFYWRMRIHYFLGSILWKNHWSPYHYNALVKPSWALAVLRMLGFDMFNGYTPNFLFDWRVSIIDLKCGKRE